MFENLKRKILFKIYKFCQKKLDLESIESDDMRIEKVGELVESKLKNVEIEFDEKMIRVVEIMLESKNEMVSKINELIVCNEDWITNHYFKEGKK